MKSLSTLFFLWLATAICSPLRATEDNEYREVHNSIANFPVEGYEISSDEQSIFDQLLLESPMGHNIDEALINAANNGYQYILNYLLKLNSPVDQCPSQRAVNLALGDAASLGYNDIVTHLLNPFSTIRIRPSEDRINDTLMKASFYGHSNIVRYLLHPESPLCSVPTQDGVNNALIDASYFGYLTIASYLLNPESPLTISPNQEGVDGALFRAAWRGHSDLVGYFLNPTNSMSVRPSEPEIVNVFNELRHHPDRQEICALLIPFVPQTQRMGLINFAEGSSSLPPTVQITSQEAIYNEVQVMREVFNRLATDPISRTAIVTSLPKPEETEDVFFTSMTEINWYLTFLIERSPKKSKLNFRLMIANRALQILCGNASVGHHRYSSLESYRTRVCSGLPDIRQIFVLACRLLQPTDIKTFINHWMATSLARPTNWIPWSEPFRDDFRGVADQADVGLALGADAQKGHVFERFIYDALQGKNLVKSPSMGRSILAIKKAYQDHIKDRLMPLIEALFMVMRGHNRDLESPFERNRPACADGAYLNILKAITQTPGISELAARELDGLEITDCSMSEDYIPRRSPEGVTPLSDEEGNGAASGGGRRF
jgi:hypothetical protein